MRKAEWLTVSEQNTMTAPNVPSMRDQPLVSVIIVTWNRKEDMIVTITSVYEQDYKQFEIIVVDNGSTDGTVSMLCEQFPDVRVIALEKNVGASGGRNPGIRAAQGDVVFLLDSDASLAPNTLSQIVARFMNDASIGGITCKILVESTKQIDPYSWLFTEHDKAFQNVEFDSYAFSEGASAFRRSVFTTGELFWDFLFYGREGEELAVRLWDKGCRIIYYPAAVVYHRVSPRTRVINDRQLFYDLRNALAIYIRNYPWWFLLLVSPLKIASSLVKGLKYRNLYFFFEALSNTVSHMPYLLQQRAPIGNDNAWKYLRIQRKHGPFRWSLATWLTYNKYQKFE